MSRRPLLIGLAAAAALTACLAPAAQAGSAVKAPTELAIYTVTSSPDELFVLGELRSEDPRCVGNRRVSISYERGAGGLIPIDTARTSDNGGWLGVRDSAEVTSAGPFTKAVVSAPKRKVKISKRKTLVCQGTTIDYPFTD